MYCRVATDDCPIANLDLACQRYAIDNHAMATDLAVVCHVSIGHNQVVATDNGFTLCRRTAIDRSALAHYIVIAQLGSSVLALELQILGNTRDNRTRMNIATLAQTRTVLQHSTCANMAIVADNYVSSNVCKRINRNVSTDLCVGVDVSHRADQRVFHNRIRINIFV